MSRHYIGITQRGPSTMRNASLSETGEPEILMRAGENVSLTIDYSDWLESGETISSASVVAESVTASVGDVPAPGATALSVALSNATSYDDGRVTLTITTSAASVRKEVIRVRRPSLYGDEQYYRDYA